MEEIWKPIEGYENYEISNLGNIVNRITAKPIKHLIDSKGYLYVTLYSNKKAKLHRVHRSMATEFIENPENRPCVDHIDRNIKNNILSNLRWATLSENQMNKSRHANNSSSVTGVYLDKRRQKWCVRIYSKGKKYFGGQYANFEDAVAKRKELEDIHFKDFKRIN